RSYPHSACMTHFLPERRRALVTGASSGIGLAFARVLAQHGFDLVLTARRHDRLEALAASLIRDHGIEAVVLPDDLSDPQSPQRITDALASRALDVDLLVNNAGFGVPGRYVSTTWEQ